MAIKFEHECDWCEQRKQVSLPKSGPLDLSKVPLPEEWSEVESFPGGKVGPQDGQQLCEVCKTEYAAVLEAADKARDDVYRAAMLRAKQTRGSRAAAGKTTQSSSFAR